MPHELEKIPRVRTLTSQEVLNAVVRSGFHPTIASGIADLHKTLGVAALNAYRILKVAPESQLFADNFPGTSLDLVNRWTEAFVGTASHIVANAGLTQRVVGPSSKATAQTRQVIPYTNGFSNIVRVRMRFPSMGQTGVTRRFGFFNTSNGYFFRQDATGMVFVLRRSGVDTVKDSTDFLVPFTPDTTAHSFTIQHTGATRVFAFIDEDMIWQQTPTVQTLIGDAQLPLRFEIESDATASGTHDMECFGVMVVREGTNFSFTADNKLEVSVGAVATPVGTTSVKRGGFVTLGANQVIDDLYPITNNKVLTIQLLRVRAEDAGQGKNVMVELFEDPNGNLSVLNRIDTLFAGGGGHNFDSSQGSKFVGNAVRRILMRTTQLGAASQRADRTWLGFEE